MVRRNSIVGGSMKRLLIIVFAGILGVGAAQAKSTTGWASYYKMGKRTANGERYDPNGLTAAHRTLPFGTKVLVTNLGNGKSVIVRINDRGPFSRKRVLDLSFGAAKVVGLVRAGVAKVEFKVLN
jgi:rare lipoprotein A